MSGWTMVAANQTDKGTDFIFNNCDPNAVAQAVDQYFRNRKYKLETGAPGNAMYGIGSDLLRIFFGAFVKRYKFSAQVMMNGGQTVLRVEKGMSGAMGGLIGHSSMKREATAVMGDLQTLFSARS